jgi:sugar phosphate isomerase/epimerase
VFRVGTTSYIIPDELLPNVEYVGPLVDDVQLVLFETDGYGSNLPDADLVARLRCLAEEHGLTYTVHLPVDLRLGGGAVDGEVSLVKARRVIEATRGLEPYAYTLHLDGRELLGPGGVAGTESTALRRWQEDSRCVLEIVCGWLDDSTRLCVENVEGWDPEAFAPVVSALPVSRTIDVGHLWLQQVDPMDHLERWIDRARVIHLHGLAGRDHASLAWVPPEKLDPVISLLVARFSGVVTLEVFDREDLETSLEALSASGERGAAVIWAAQQPSEGEMRVKR